MAIRSPICTVVGHVDHGKSSILDKIRGSTIINTEPGMITQHVGASIVPIKTIQKICGDLIKKTKLTIPGLLFIDTPGHEAFTSLRKRGGNLADIAILVIDINEGFKPQTLESIKILKISKTPFIIAANKVDLLPGWKSKEKFVLNNIQKQTQNVVETVEKKMYEIVGKLSELDFNSERFDRIDDFTKQIAIVPCSAKTGEGIPELLMVISGLAQKFLEECLKCDVKGNAKGSVLEVKEEKGLGTTIDVIIYNGTLKQNDTIVIGSVDKPIVTKVRALLEPAPLKEMRDKKTKFKSVKQVFAAVGVKISAPELDKVIAGMPIVSCKQSEVEKVKKEIQKEVKEALIEIDKDGIIIKADTLGSLEALVKLLKDKDIMVRKAQVGNITKKDISDAESNEDILKSVILGFNVVDDSKVKSSKVKIIVNKVIYKLIEDFEAWVKEEKIRQEAGALDELTMPCKVELLKGYVFRQNNPAIVGVEVIGGILKTGIGLMKKDGKEITNVLSMQEEKKNVNKAEKEKRVAASLSKVTVGRQINEGDILYSAISEQEFRKLKEVKKHLTKEDIEILKEIAEIKRKENVLWGV